MAIKMPPLSLVPLVPLGQILRSLSQRSYRGYSSFLHLSEESASSNPEISHVIDGGTQCLFNTPPYVSRLGEAEHVPSCK